MVPHEYCRSGNAAYTTPYRRILPIKRPSAITSLTYTPVCCKIDNGVVNSMVKASNGVVKNGEEEAIEETPTRLLEFDPNDR
jgi:hypothetical protein